MDSEGTRQRKPGVEPTAAGASLQVNGSHKSAGDEHPAGPIKHGPWTQALRIVLFGLYFFTSCIFIHFAQLIGAPLYFVNKDYFYTYMAVTKQYFALLITTMTQWWSPTVVRISGDESMAGQLTQTEDGRVETAFPERIVLIANHQIYTDWLYLWWIAYTNRMHGHLYIILKQSLKWVPIIGPAMQFYGFIFMARKWSSDQERMKYRIQKLSARRTSAASNPSSPTSDLDPMWLMIFPEGTNLSANTRRLSGKWADKAGTPDVKHTVLPRSRGLQFCLQELKDTVEYVYDCTIAYEKIPRGQYGQDIFTLRSVYFQGRAPKSVNMYWRRFKVSDIPVQDEKQMEDWTLARWREKDAALEQFQATGRFPAHRAAISGNGKAAQASDFIETEVRPKSPIEFLQMFLPVLGVALVINVIFKMIHMFG